MSVENIDLDIDELKEEIKKLKGVEFINNTLLKNYKIENEKLKEDDNLANEYRKIICKILYEDWDDDRPQELNSLYTNFRYGRLGADELEDLTNLLKFYREYVVEGEQLKEHNLELNNENDDLQGQVEKLNCECGLFEEQIQELKEEIEELKKPKPRRTITCSSCGQTGHNKTSKKCPNIIDA